MKVDLKKFEGVETPFYYYDRKLLGDTLRTIAKCTEGKPVKVHYALKANGNPDILRFIAAHGLGADCVSGGEIEAALLYGFNPGDIFYAGVGKTDREIEYGIEKGIGCFNVESVEELEVIAALAEKKNRVAPVALRVNPNIDAHTHHYITTGLEENKFGIDMTLLDSAVEYVKGSKWLDLVGLHFHIGSQITTMEPFEILCHRINALQNHYAAKGIRFRIINVGGGLGIDYDDPDANPISDFKAYFDTLLSNLELSDGQELHCELGRSIVAQCGSLISTVVLVKKGIGREFVIVDAGMSDLLRPALYGAHHNIENISAVPGCETKKYDVVGPICESSDVFGKGETLPETKRGDLIAFRSAGAYGESMASCYNMRRLPGSLFV